MYICSDNEYRNDILTRVLGEARLYSRALHVGKMTFNQHALRFRQD